MLSFDETQSASRTTRRAHDGEPFRRDHDREITYAARNSDFEGRDIHEGEYLALYNGALLGNSPDLDSLLAAMAEKAAGEGKEFVNIFYGADTTAEQAAHASEIFAKALPSAEVNVLSGGQPIYYYLISAE